MLSLKGTILLMCCVLSQWSGTVGDEGVRRSVSAVRRGPWQHEIVEGLQPKAAVTANFTNQINLNGWSFLEIHTEDGTIPDEELAYMAGMLEANLTASLIQMHWKNIMGTYCTTASDYCTKLESFISQNSDFVAGQIRSSAGSDYWHQVNLFNMQLAGLKDGYSKQGLDELPQNAFLLLQIQGDLEDLESALGGGATSRVVGSGSCSALVKLLPGNSELLVSHDTWSDYRGMLRIFKHYDLKFRMTNGSTTTIPGYRQSFSSYPGVLLSGDDFYMINSGLVTMETTIGNNNADLWKYVTPQSVFEGIRAVVANRLATSGSEWASIFGDLNSGTYNNEWMVVDYKLFTKGEKNLQDNLLWVLEQIPGTVKHGDQTDVLRNTSYWPSYNIAYYPSIFNMSGSQELVNKYGDWFTWSGAPRAKIFARDHDKVVDLSSMIKLMRYNDFQHDPLGKCNCTPPYSGENGISARSDLNPANGTYPFSALGHRSHGGTDNKVTSSALFSELSCWATSGPTYDQQPVFQWSTSGFNPTPLGHPDKWAFSPVLVKWNTLN